MVKIQNVKLSMVLQRVHVYPVILEARYMVADTNAKVTANVVHKNFAKIINAHRLAHNVVKVHNVHVYKIIGQFANVLKDILAVHIRNVVQNVMVIEIVRQVDQHAIMEFARIHVMDHVALVLIVIYAV